MILKRYMDYYSIVNVVAFWEPDTIMKAIKNFLLYPKHCIMLQRINDLQRHSESSINNLKNNQDTKKKLGNISKIVRY